MNSAALTEVSAVSVRCFGSLVPAIAARVGTACIILEIATAAFRYPVPQSWAANSHQTTLWIAASATA